MESCLSLCSPKAEPENRAWVLSLRGKEVQEAGGGGSREPGRRQSHIRGIKELDVALGQRAPSCKTPSGALCARIVPRRDGGVTFISNLLPLPPPPVKVTWECEPLPLPGSICWRAELFLQPQTRPRGRKVGQFPGSSLRQDVAIMPGTVRLRDTGIPRWAGGWCRSKC